MVGCVLGLLGAALLVKGILRARRFACGGGYGGHGGYGGNGGCHGGWHRRARGPSTESARGPFYRTPFDGPFGDDDGAPMMLRGVFERLRTTPGQERAIVEALRELKASMRKAGEQGQKAAASIGDAMRAEELSTEDMGAAYAHLDDAAEALRSASFSTLAKIHSALDAAQRKVLADFLKRPRGLEDLADGA